MTATGHRCFPCHFTEYRLKVTLRRKIKHRSYLTKMMVGKLKQLFCGKNLFRLNVMNQRYPCFLMEPGALMCPCIAKIVCHLFCFGGSKQMIGNMDENVIKMYVSCLKIWLIYGHFILHKSEIDQCFCMDKSFQTSDFWHDFHKFLYNLHIVYKGVFYNLTLHPYNVIVKSMCKSLEIRRNAQWH